jgi:hypothetical protein
LSRTFASVLASSAAVGSSRSQNVAESRASARATDSRLRWPPLRRSPVAPISARKAPSSSRMKPPATAASAAASTFASTTGAEPYVTASTTRDPDDSRSDA